MTLLVVGALPGATVQDLGRFGLRAIGVASAGAADPTSLRIANRLLGNAPTDAAIEVTLGGFRVTAQQNTWISLSGGEAPVMIDDRPVGLWSAHRLAAGETLSIGYLERGARIYVGVHGGVDEPLVLGSRSTDTMSGLGPAPLAVGRELTIGVPSSAVPPNDLTPWRVPGDAVTVQVRQGPRREMFSRDAWRMLTSAEWTVSANADRVGLRLDGPGLERIDEREIASEGMVIGALQVPPSGRPVILLGDGPVTGGYPVIGVVAFRDLDALGQLRPGSVIRFRE